MKTATLPIWLQQTSSADLPKHKNSWSYKDYLEKTFEHINGIMAEDAYSTRISSSKGVLQSVQVPVKIVGLVVLMIAASLTKSLAFLFLLNAVILGVALRSGLGFRAVSVRVWLPTCLFAGIAVLPGILNWVTPGEPLVIIYHDLAITKQGVQAAAFVLLRAGASLGLATLLIKTTRWSLLTKAFVQLGLPGEIVTVLDLTYRYIYMFLLLFMEYLLGRRSRLVGLESQSAKISWIGGTIAAFLRMIWEYSQEINDAMQSRGYSGEYIAEPRMPLTLREFCFLFLVMVLCVCAYGGILYV
jgi:cobalt/nickel transport system permease protein